MQGFPDLDQPSLHTMSPSLPYFLSHSSSFPWRPHPPQASKTLMRGTLYEPIHCIITHPLSFHFNLALCKFNFNSSLCFHFFGPASVSKLDHLLLSLSHYHHHLHHLHHNHHHNQDKFNSSKSFQESSCQCGLKCVVCAD